MLKITELRIAMEAAELAFDAALEADAPRATERKLEKAMAAAQSAYHKELDAARALQAQYEAMPDDDAHGSTNAGDTFDHATYGDDRHRSTEYWRCAIDSAQMMNDEAAAIAKRKAERDAWMAEEAAEAAALAAAEAAAWKVTVHPLCAGHFAVSRKLGDRREYVMCEAGAAKLIKNYYSRGEAQAVADSRNTPVTAPAEPIEIHISADYCAATPRDQWESPDHAWIVEGEGNYFGSFADLPAAEACARENAAEFQRLGQRATCQINA